MLRIIFGLQKLDIIAADAQILHHDAFVPFELRIRGQSLGVHFQLLLPVDVDLVILAALVPWFRLTPFFLGAILSAGLGGPIWGNVRFPLLSFQAAHFIPQALVLGP